tara:strand:+ start:484 stop:960 length:477 start_codon:yes stop_codon:yes gene_type:complete
MRKIILSLGSNMGDRKNNLKLCIKLLKRRLRISKTSNIYETEPWGNLKHQPYLNLAIEVVSGLNSYSILKFTKEIEREMGRYRKNNLAPRIIDIDIITFGNQLILKNDLQVPHKRFTKRMFVLKPMSEINLRMKIPKSNFRVYQVINCSKDLNSVRIF